MVPKRSLAREEAAAGFAVSLAHREADRPLAQPCGSPRCPGVRGPGRAACASPELTPGRTALRRRLGPGRRIAKCARQGFRATHTHSEGKKAMSF